MGFMNRKIGVGILWNLASLLLTRGVSTVFMLYLARMLAPGAFGLVAMAAVVFELASSFVNSGLGVALIRSKEVSDADLNTVFYTNLGLSLVAYVAIYASAPHIAVFYSQPELTSLVQAMGLVVFINAAKIVQSAVLTRKMDFKTQMKADTLAIVVSGLLAVTAAYQGWEEWSLVVQMLSQAAVSAVVIWVVGDWRPASQFSPESFSRLFAFGRNLLAEGLLSVLYLNSYILVIGRFFSSEVTGLYFFAQKISNLISEQLTDAIQRATFPALSTLQDENVKLKQKYRQIMQLMMFLIAPIMMLLAALAPQLITLMFDEQWQGVVPYLQLLCVVGMIYPLHALNINLLNVKGRSDLIFRVGLVKKAVNLAMLFLAIPFGVLGIIVSRVIGTVLALIPNTYFSARLIGYSTVEQVKDVIKPIFAALLAGACAHWSAQIIPGHPLLMLMLPGFVGIGIYIVVSFIVRAEGALILWGKVADWL